MIAVKRKVRINLFYNLPGPLTNPNFKSPFFLQMKIRIFAVPAPLNAWDRVFSWCVCGTDILRPYASVSLGYIISVCFAIHKQFPLQPEVHISVHDFGIPAFCHGYLFAAAKHDICFGKFIDRGYIHGYRFMASYKVISGMINIKIFREAYS